MAIRSFQKTLPTVHQSAYVDEHAVVIGHVEIGENSSIWPTAVLRGDMLKIAIGDMTSIQDGTICHTTHAGPYNKEGHALTVGNNVTVGHQVVLHGCTIGNHCLIGMQSIILDGAIIEDNVMLGAGSLVSPNKILESGFLYLGRPAIKKRALTQDEIAFIQYSATHYAKLKDTYLNATP